MSEPVAPSKTADRRADAQRNIAAILDAARAVLVKDPYATMVQIAERSGVGRATLYRHFGSRERLVEQLVRGSVAAVDGALAIVDLEVGDAREAMRRATAAWLVAGRRWRTARYAPLSLGSADASSSAIRERVGSLLVRGQRDGTIRDDVTPEDLYRAWVGMVVVWIDGSEETDAEEVSGLILDILLPTPTPG